MGEFNNKIEAEFNPPRKWILARALSYQNEEMEESALQSIGIKCPASRITCKIGFVTDLASVPRMIWNLIAPWDVASAAIIHDFLYKSIRQYRAKAAKEAADKVFLMAMKDSDPKVPSWKIYAAYTAVDLFGRWSIIPREDDDQM